MAAPSGFASAGSSTLGLRLATDTGGCSVLRRSILACGLLLAFAGLCSTAAVGATHVTPHAKAHRVAPRRSAVAFYSDAIRKLRAETWYWQRVMGVRRTRDARSRSLASTRTSVHALQHLVAVWRRREKAAYRHAQHPPNLAAWLCIHHYEGSWRDPGAPYYGGLQMDLSFQRAYGGWLLRKKGTADHWTALEQIWTAVKARRLRGYYPWPNTARFCGLL
jgi:hypothetical protein